MNSVFLAIRLRMFPGLSEAITNVSKLLFVFQKITQTYVENVARDAPERVRAWGLFCMLSRMLLHRMRKGGSASDDELQRRVRLLDEGRWDILVDASCATVPRGKRRQALEPDSAEDWAQRLLKAKTLVAKGELSNAARLIRSNGLAPGDHQTLA